MLGSLHACHLEPGQVRGWLCIHIQLNCVQHKFRFIAVLNACSNSVDLQSGSKLMV